MIWSSDRNSKRPSVPNKKILSSSKTSKVLISGTLVTPTDFATSSPIDLVIASPGTVWLLQTLKGPFGFP